MWHSRVHGKAGCRGRCLKEEVARNKCYIGYADTKSWGKYHRFLVWEKLLLWNPLPPTRKFPSDCLSLQISGDQKKTNKSSWWFQPIWKICSSKWVHLPQVRVKITKILETTIQKCITSKPPSLTIWSKQTVEAPPSPSTSHQPRDIQSTTNGVENFYLAEKKQFLHLGVSLKGGNPQNTLKWSFLVGKPWLLGTPIFGNTHFF